MDRRLLLQAIAGAALGGPAMAAFAQAPGELTVQTVADAWLAGLAIIEMAAARARMTHTKSAGLHAGLNAFRHTRELIGPKDHAITTPNNDTLYSNAFIDLTRGPVTLTVPEAGARYLSVAIMDFYTNNNVILGAHTPGGAAGHYTIVGPGHRAPTRGRVLRIATPHAWVLARVLVDGPKDMAAAHPMQDGCVLKGPAIGPYPTYAIRSDDWSAYFRSVNGLMAVNPPTSRAGLAALSALKARSPTFSRAALGADAAIVDEGVARAKAVLGQGRGNLLFIDGWQYPLPDLGDFGDNFRYRALVAVGGLGALKVQEAMYMRPAGDTGRTLFQGDQTWRLSLPAALPVDAFWSLTMYEATSDGQFFLTENPLNRYAIGDRTPGLKVGPNGAVDLWVGRHDPGGDRTSNWLPAPTRGPYSLSLRAYNPKQSLLNGGYRLPAMTPV